MELEKQRLLAQLADDLDIDLAYPRDADVQHLIDVVADPSHPLHDLPDWLGQAVADARFMDQESELTAIYSRGGE